MTLRIVHVVCTNRFAGTERYVARLAEAQVAAGHQVHVLSGSVLRERLAPGVGHAPGATVRDALRSMRSLSSADVLHAHMTDAEAVLALHPGHRAAHRVVTRHFAQRRGSSPIRRAAATVAGTRLDGQIAVSRYVADRIEGSATVIHPGVPVMPASAGPRERILLVVQRLEAEKATDLALSAFARAGLAGDWRMQVAGTGACADDLRGHADRLGIAAHVEFLGARDDVPALLSRAAAFVAPCPNEHFGLSVVEAMSAGLPVIASASAGHLESAGPVDPTWLFAPGDVNGAATRLRRVAEDPGAGRAYGDALRVRQQDLFTIERWQSETDRFYRDLR